MRPMDKSDVVHKIREHFSRPGAVFAMQDAYGDYDSGVGNEEKVCVYRFQENPHSPIRCAMGCLIPDEMYDPEMEAETAERLLMGLSKFSERDEQLAELPPLKRLFADDPNMHEFLTACQNAHDDAARGGCTIGEFLAELNRVARDYGVKTSDG